MDYNLWAMLILIIIVPPALVALAVVLDRQSRRGYALGALALGAFVLALWGYSVVYWQEDQSLPVLTFAIVIGGFFAALELTLGAIVETLIARQWWWLGFIIIVSVVPVVFMFPSPATLGRHLLGTLGIPAEAESLVLQLPVLVTLVYAMFRSIRRPFAL